MRLTAVRSFREEDTARPGRLTALVGRVSPRAWVGITGSELQRTHLSLPRYSALTGGGLALAAVQVMLMPRWLAPRQFGLVVLSISATQAVLQLGDLGLVRVCIDGTRSPADRSQLRHQGRSMTLLSTTALLLVTAGLWPVVASPQRPVLVAMALGGLAAQMVAADKFRGARAEVAGDEVAASGLNFLWTNAPKLGLVIGVLFFRSVVGITSLAFVVAWLLCAPVWPRYHDAWTALRRVGVWGLPFTAIGSSFVLMWGDTYFLSAHVGVARAGAYEALYRVMGACTYGFLPWVSVLTSRVSVAEGRPIARPLLLAVAVTAALLACATGFILALGRSFFPHLRLPLEAVPGLLALYMLLPASYCLGSALYVRAQGRAVTYITAVGAGVALVGHALFTLRGGPAAASVVTATAMAVVVVALALVYRRSAIGLLPGVASIAR